MEINIIWNICRICLEERKNVSGANEPQMCNIFEENKKLAKYIYEFTGIFMKPNDSLPDKMCLKCLKIINNAVKFRKTCRNSNAYLLSILERTQKAGSLIFKPECIEDHITDEEFIEEEDEKMFVEEKVWEEVDVKHSKLDKDQKNNNVLDKRETLNDDIQKEDELNDSIQELDEFIEHFEDSSSTTELACIETIDCTKDDSITNKKQQDKEKIKPKTTQLQKFLMDTKFNEGKDTNKEKVNEGELYYLIEDIAETISNDNTKKLKDFDEEDLIEESVQDNDGDVMLQLEEQNYEDNQAQVTSTVDTNDETVYSEDNSQESNISKDVYVISDSNNNSSQDSSICQIISDNNNSSQDSSISQMIEKNTTKNIKRKTNTKTATSLVKTEASSHHINVCDICGNQFNNRPMLKLHMKIHNQEKNHQCEICFKSFVTACNLQAHMRIHTGEKPFECKYCARRFSDRTSHIRHERTHTNEKPFKCTNCDKTFTLATTLQNHIKVHTNERSYRCEPCGKSFKLSHHLKTHQNTLLHRSTMLTESKGS